MPHRRLFPIHTDKPLMLHNLSHSTPPNPQTSFSFGLHQITNNLLRIVVYRLWPLLKLIYTLEDAFRDIIKRGILAQGKRRVSREHLENEYAESVPVNTCGVPIRPRFEYLWRHVFGRTTECTGSGSASGITEICELDVAICCDEDVFWFEVAEYDVVRVEMPEREDDL